LAPSIGDIFKGIQAFKTAITPIIDTVTRNLDSFFDPINLFVHSKLYLPTCFIVILYMLFFRRKHFEIKIDAITKFITLMVIASFLKISWWNLTKTYITDYAGIDIGGFLLVPLEDMFYVMVPYFINEKLKNKYTKGTIWVLFSILFASGHLYQGLLGFVTTSIYPYFISRYFAQKTSFTNVMICHFLYDCFIILAAKMSNLIVLNLV
jgi:hypothetical protein